MLLMFWWRKQPYDFLTCGETIAGLKTIQQRRAQLTEKPVLLTGPGKVGVNFFCHFHLVPYFFLLLMLSWFAQLNANNVCRSELRNPVALLNLTSFGICEDLYLGIVWNVYLHL